ncbi:MAG: hypothetical protein HC934_06155 [Acaryochloridaceae cyanobacterium SU_2_1]|nr:hypothetical protein [Acaryochloridaceae cyanobacterium SU_2_1]NJM95575.1 hypothetical protein [Acaryochloridaceae cyanobacterium CSU_5_19]
MKLLRNLGSLTTLGIVAFYSAIHTPYSYAAQIGLGENSSVDLGGVPLGDQVPLTETDITTSNICAGQTVFPDGSLEEQPSEESLNQPLSSLGPNLVASNGTADVSVGFAASPILIAQAIEIEDCGLGGIPPEGGLPLAGGFPFAALAGLAPLAAIPALIGGGDPDPVPPVPEPAEVATAGLFAALGVAGILAKRKLKRSH